MKEHLIRNSVRITSWNQMREETRDHENTTVHRQSTNANAARSESEEHRQWKREQRQRQGQRQSQGCEERIVRESEKRRSENLLDTAAVVPLQCLLSGERHSSTFVIAMPCVNSETSCEFSSKQAVGRPGAGSFAPAETQRVSPIAAIPSNETYLMMETCAGASIFPRGFDQSAADDSTVAPVRNSTATDDPVHGDAGKRNHVLV